MGGSDFNAVDPYTYDDASYEDFDFYEFSIAKDRDFVIPVLREILAINPSVQIMATPWSPPAWMKQTWTLNGGELKEGGTYHGAFADYLIRFIRAYEAEGITIDTLASVLILVRVEVGPFLDYGPNRNGMELCRREQTR